MLLKRLYKKVGPKNRLEVRGIDVLKMPKTGKKHFSEKFVKNGITEGWLSESAGTLTIHAQGGDVLFKVIRAPGRYCCHCAEKLADDDNTSTPGALAQAHVAEQHAGKASPDADHPAGYECIRYFDCEHIEG